MRLSGLVAIAAGMAVTAVGTADVALASEMSRRVDFSSPGATYDSATIATWPPNGARAIALRMVGPGSFGGVRLRAVGTTTSLDGAASPAANMLGFLPLVATVTPPCEYDDEGDCIEQDPIDECTPSLPIGRAYGRPKQNGVWKRVTWTAVGCTSDLVNFGTFPIATGVTTYTVSKYQRFTKPAVYNTYFQGSDDYFNICLTADYIGDIVQENGRLSCTVLQSARIDRVKFRIKQTTKITARSPAYVCPGYTFTSGRAGCNRES